MDRNNSKSYIQYISPSATCQWLLIITFLLIIFVFACTSVSKSDSDGYLTLADYPIGNDNKLVVKLSVAPCQNKKCNIVVQLSKNGALSSELPLEWSASTQVNSESAVGRWYGAGDPLDESTSWRAWTIGESEYDYLVVVAQLVTLADNLSGLLVHQTTGFEHTLRHHDLFVVTNGKLIKAWSKTESPGPSWSTVLSPAGKSGPQELIFFEALKTGDMESTDSLDISFLSWDAKTKRIIQRSKGATPLFYISVYPFEGIKAARSFAEKHTACLGYDYILLKGDIVSKALKAKYTLSAVTHLKPSAEQARNKLTKCFSDKMVEIF